MPPSLVPSPLAPARLAAAGQRFVAFFRELTAAFAEREDLLSQIALALVAREHVLMTGPPGTAKSQLSSAVLGRIVDEQTGRPSLYSRQFTESTVQTDLVGPIDFKTLMETGRTEHFTDEGMLGAVHAFLDEVFDGRDMLLRSALNVLHERELKQGTKTTEGRIEVALMTTNRYLAEVLDGTRDTLLAFIDRVAFVSYLPRGFADPANLTKVLLRQLHRSTSSDAGFQAQLTVQDLDVLQAWTQSVDLGEEACAALSAFFEALETELSQVARADPSFQQTRYLSTRTAVRCGRLLRAAVIIDRMFVNPSRPLQVLPQDFRYLRFHLLLCGPLPEMAEKLLARETDPRERRQLSILRAEREAFDRCIARIQPWQPNQQQGEEAFSKIRARADEALRRQDALQLAQISKELVSLVQAGGDAGDQAAALLQRAADCMSSHALRAGLLEISSEQVIGVSSLVTNLSKLATAIEDSGPTAHAVARWLRGRALTQLDATFRFGLGGQARDVIMGLGNDKQVTREAAERAEQRLILAEQLAKLRADLLAAGATPVAPSSGATPAGTPADAVLHERSANAQVPPWDVGVLALEEDIASLVDASFRERVAEVLSANQQQPISTMLRSLSLDFAALDTLAVRITGLGGPRSRLKERVVGPRLVELLGALLVRQSTSEADNIAEQIDDLIGTLQQAGLREAVPTKQWLVWTAASLVNGEPSPAPDGSGAEEVSEPPRLRTAFDHRGYRALRKNERRTPITLRVREVALRVLPESERAAMDPARAERAVSDLITGLPDVLANAIADRDLARVDRSISYLERWWTTLGTTTSKGRNDADRLGNIARSGFLTVVRDEAALIRFALEAQLVAECFPRRAPAAVNVRQRIETLHDEVRTTIAKLSGTARDEAWSVVLVPTSSNGAAR